MRWTGTGVCRADAEGGRRCPHHQKGSNLARHNERRRRNRAIKGGIVQWARDNGVSTAQVAELQQMGPRSAKEWANQQGLDPETFAPAAPNGEPLPSTWASASWMTPRLTDQISTVLAHQGKHPAERRLLEGAVVDSVSAVGGTNTTNRVELDNGQVGYHKSFDGLDNDLASDFGHSSAQQVIHEVAAWQLARRLGQPWSQIVPPCVLREVDGEPGSFALERPGRPTGGAGRSPVWQQAAFFDSLIGQQDRHRGNFLMDRDRITLIDHGYTFARLGDPWNQSGLQAGRRDSLLSDAEVDALNRLLDSPDTFGLAGILEPDRLDALRSRAKLMRKNKSILPPGSY